MRTAIIGAGAMGKWFAEFSEDLGWDTVIADIDDGKARQVSEELGIESTVSNAEAAQGSDIVLISVPIKETPQVMEELAPVLGEKSLLVDIASVKEAAVDKMKELDAKCELASIHPLFGPGAKSLKGKNVISVPIRTDKTYDNFKETLSKFGANIKEMDANNHDRLMSITQSLTHFTLLTYLKALKSMNRSEEAKAFQTPISKKLQELSKAFLHEDPKLCGDIQTENRYASMARTSIQEACRSLIMALKAKNIKAIDQIFDEALENIDIEEVEEAYEKIHEEWEDK